MGKERIVHRRESKQALTMATITKKDKKINRIRKRGKIKGERGGTGFLALRRKGRAALEVM